MHMNAGVAFKPWVTPIVPGQAALLFAAGFEVLPSRLLSDQ